MKTQLLLWLAFLAGSLCGVSPSWSFAAEESCGKQDAVIKMTYEEARTLAAKSECAEKGKLKDTHFCNENSGTWWIDLEVTNTNCTPACVIEVETRQVSINWRCTGLREGNE